MKEINSSILGTEPVECGEEIGMLDTYSGLKTPFADDVIILSTLHKNEVEDFATNAALAYGSEDGAKEQTRAEVMYGLPALVVRVDCTIVDGHIQAYELEDSPSGMGVSHRFVQAATGNDLKGRILDHYGETAGEIPHLIISGSRKHGTDDELIVGSSNYHYEAECHDVPKIDSTSALIIKAIPGVSESHEPYLGLQSRCIAPLATEGDKSYAERIGIFKPVSDASELLMNDGVLVSQVVKARLGSMAMGVSIYLSPEDRVKYGKGGQVKGGRLIRDLEKYANQGGALVQELHPPIQMINSANRNNAILRIFVLLSRNGSGEVNANAIGGAYVARPEMIVHGASNAVSGAILVE